MGAGGARREAQGEDRGENGTDGECGLPFRVHASPSHETAPRGGGPWGPGLGGEASRVWGQRGAKGCKSLAGQA
ncbi:hypothetical protein Smic_81910 [Streptomyces microflavus]|uniref:Uncharacterized protein n=1 Tax=Streptomyces microflavus TaxID=1919 RepID=A0A7J0D6H0_STRMI|nr:hypothetical protein Smic_81910 [Streptomyces microflavus]